MRAFRKAVLCYVTALLALPYFIPSVSSASVPKAAGIVTQVAGQATLHRVGLTDSLPVKFRDRVFLQDQIHTQERTFVRVLLGGKALVTVRELSVLTITEDLNHATIDIQSGVVGLSVARKRMKPGEFIEIRTPHAIAAVRGTKVLTQVSDFTNMSVLEGFVDIAAIGTPTQTIKLLQLSAVQATGVGLGKTGPMSDEAIAISKTQFQPHDNTSRDDSPLSNSVADQQSVQAAALAEVLAPKREKKELRPKDTESTKEDSDPEDEDSELQAEESESGESDGDSDSGDSVLSSRGIEIDLKVPPNRNFPIARSFNTAKFSGGMTQGTGPLTIDGTTTVTGGTNTVGNHYTSKGQVKLNKGSINFTGGGTHEGGFSTSAGTTLEFGGGTHDITNDVKGSGTVLVSGGEVNINGGEYDITGNSTSLTGGTMTFNIGSTLTSLGPLSVNAGLINFLSGEAVSLSSFDFSGGTVSGTDIVTATGTTTVSGTGTKTINAPFNNEGPLTLQDGTLRLLGNGTHTGSFTSQAGTTLEFGSGIQNFTGTTFSGAGTVNLTGGTFNTTGTTTMNNPFNNQADVNVNGGSFALNGGGTHTGDFATTAGTTLEFGGGTHQVAGSSLSGPGTVSVSAGELSTQDKLFELSADLTTVDTLFEQTGGTTTIGSTGNASSDALAIGTQSLDASGTTDALFDISGGDFTTDGSSSDLIESSSGGGSVTTGGSAVALSGTGSITLKGSDSSILQSVGAGTTISTGSDAVTVSGNSTLDLDDETTNDVALIQSGGSLETDGSVLKVSDSATANVGQSVGRLESGGLLTTTNVGHVLDSTGGTTTLGDSVLDLEGSTSQADISGYVVSATGGQINGPAGFNLVDVNAGELNTDDGIIQADGDDRIILDSGTTDAVVDINSSDGTHDLGTTSGEAVFNLSGTSSSDTPLTKKDGSNNDIAIDQTLLASTGATINTKQFLAVDQALLDASAPLLNLMANGGTSSTMTADPGDGNGFIDVSNQAVVRNNTNTMPMLTLSNSTLSLTTGHLLALSQSQLSFMGDFISLSDGSSLSLNSANGFLVFATGNSSLTVTGAFINFGGTGSNTVTVQNSSFSETINGIRFSFTNGATNAQVTVNGTPIQNPSLGTVSTPNSGSLIQVDGTQATVTIQGS